MYRSKRSGSSRRVDPQLAAFALGLMALAVIGFIGAIYFDLVILLALPVLILAAAMALRFALEVSLVLLISGPVLLSTIPVGSFTLDNLSTAVGIALACWASLVRFRLPSVGASAFPLSLAIAVAITTASLGASDIAGVLRFVGIGLAAWAAFQLEVEKPGYPRIVLSLILTIGALSVIAQPTIGFPTPFIDREGDGGFRFGGLLGHPNFAAYVFAVGALWLLARKRTGARYWVQIGLLVAAMLVTGSRTAFLLFVGAAVILLVNDLRRAALIAVALLLFAFTIGTTMVTRIEALLTSSGSQANSGTWRVEQWQRALDMRAGYELFGIGWQRIEELTPNGLGAHSGYVQLLVELGLVGAVITSAGLVIAVASTVRSRLSAIVWLYILGASTTDPVFLYPSVAVVAVVVLALDSPKLRREVTPLLSATSHRAPGTGSRVY